jgi:antitoxin (DNA-binding transcriptional repressor) of toxin-antitoxin stability system
MRTISALEVRAKFGQVLDEAAAGERFVVERGGHAVAAIVPLRDLDAVDPDKVRAQRRAALEDLRRMGSVFREPSCPSRSSSTRPSSSGSQPMNRRRSPRSMPCRRGFCWRLR